MHKVLLHAFAACVLLTVHAVHGGNGQLKIIASAPPGTPVDLRARWVAEKLAPALGEPVIVENKPGAGGNIGLQTAARSPADGRTLVIVHQGTLAINPHLYPQLGYDPIADFAPITRLVDAPLVLCVPHDFPAANVAELVQFAKQHPGTLSYGSSGVGTPPHMAAALFVRTAGIDVTHIPYKGAAASLTDLIAGRIAFTIDSAAVHGPQITAGRLRALAVTGKTRMPQLADVPTLAESGYPGYEYVSWMGVAAPAHTPHEIIERLNSVLVHALATQEARDWYASQGGDIVGDTPEEFARFIRAEYAKWGKVIREAGIHAD